MSENTPTTRGGLAPRQIVALVIAVASLVLIAVNWVETEVSLIFAQVTMPLAILLAVVFLGGMATGALVTRRRAKRS